MKPDMDVVIIDYGMGNLQSVRNAFEHLGCSVSVAVTPGELERAVRIVLPGVGAFGDGMENLRKMGWDNALDDQVRGRGKPFLGLCLGMQVLASHSTEHGSHAGLGWIPGSVDRLQSLPDSNVRVPHIGWNTVTMTHRDGMYEGLGDSADFYFVHSFAFSPRETSIINGHCIHGVEFAASLVVENIWATQYHPEKSQKSGLQVLRNFLIHCV